MELLIILNIFAVTYLVTASYLAFKRKDTMAERAHHHFISHIFIMCSSIIAINLFVYEGFVVPIAFALIYLIQHMLKEDLRLLKSNRWTPTIKED